MRSANERWYPPDKEEAIRLKRRHKPVLAIAVIVGALLVVVGYFIINPIIIRYQQMTQICELLLKYNPTFERVWLRPTAAYIIDNSFPFDPVFMAAVLVNESAAIRDAESKAGAKGFYGVKDENHDKKTPKEDYLQLQWQLETAKRVLLGFYQEGYVKITPKGKIPGYGKETARAMHNGFVGLKINQHVADAYVASIYTDLADATDMIWQKKPRRANGKADKESADHKK